jgi:FixJ family two-component response regulator
MANGRPLIAVVDDDDSVCKAVGRVILASDLDVATFTSGQMLLDSLPARRPDCVVLDLHMPGLSGIDVLHALAHAGWELPVIIITGRDQPETRTRCLTAGALAYLPKPLNHAELLQAIGKAIGGRVAPAR